MKFGGVRVRAHCDTSFKTAVPTTGYNYTACGKYIEFGKFTGVFDILP